MKESTPTILMLAVLSVALLIGLIECIRRLRRSSQAMSGGPSLVNPSMGIGASRWAHLESYLPVKPDNIFTRLSFRESLDPEKYAEASRDSALSDINRALARNAGDGVVVTLQSVRLLKSGAEMVVSASKAGKELLKAGKAELVRDGLKNAMPVLRDFKTGRVLETMKEAKSAKALAKVASLSTMVVGAAHIISGADIANTLKEHGAKLDLLLEYRRIDQLAALERIYTAAQELCAGPMTPGKQAELWRLRGELRELRITWRREYEYLLSKIEDPQSAAWYFKAFGFITAVEKIPHQAVHDKIKEGLHHMILMDYSLRVDQALAVVSGTVPEFETSLKGELPEMMKLSKLIRSKGAFIHGKYPDLSVTEIEEGFFGIGSAYERLLPSRASETEEVEG